MNTDNQTDHQTKPSQGRVSQQSLLLTKKYYTNPPCLISVPKHPAVILLYQQYTALPHQCAKTAGDHISQKSTALPQSSIYDMINKHSYFY